MSSCCVSLNRSIIVGHVLLEMVQKAMDLHVLLNLEFIAIVLANSDLSMSRSDINMFTLVINYLDDGWIPRHVTMGLFEMHEATSATMALQLQRL
jgi:hypothetical protein